ncbi:MAG: sensor histidine kinase [Acidobacteria bacterium]|nr:sensor histidine kinase [Acidobacteriota bacterium]
MVWPQPARITERGVLWALAAGFALVLGLLGAAGFAAVRGTRAIERDATEVGREQLAIARLLNDVQAGQNTMAAILHQLAPGEQIQDRDRLLSELDAADRALAGLSRSAQSTPEAPLWVELDRAVLAFAAGVRRAVDRHGVRLATDLSPLFQLHDQVVDVEQRLLVASEKRVEDADRRMEAEFRELAATSRWLMGTCLLLATVCAAATIAFARASIRKIEAQASELSRVSWHMLHSQESLARRFSHELHDELGQSLAAVKANLGAHKPAEWAARRADCLQLVDDAIRNVRELSQLLHPVILDDFGLDAGLRWLTEGFSQRTGIPATYESDFPDRLDQEAETHLFRIAQEALTNVARHADASAVRVEVRSAGGRVRMSIEDNGRGLRRSAQDTPGHHPSLGMVGMRARAQEIEGELRFLTAAGGGLRVEVDVASKRRITEDAEPQEVRVAG